MCLGGVDVGRGLFHMCFFLTLNSPIISFFSFYFSYDFIALALSWSCFGLGLVIGVLDMVLGRRLGRRQFQHQHQHRHHQHRHWILLLHILRRRRQQIWLRLLSACLIIRWWLTNWALTMRVVAVSADAERVKRVSWVEDSARISLSSADIALLSSL